MRNHKNTWRVCLAVSVLFGTAVFSQTVLGAAQQPGLNLASITEESQILPIPDKSGTYMLKSDGFYCLSGDGARHNKAAVHYFDHFVIDGTEFNGYYYHDEGGKFKAGNPYMVHLNNVGILAESGDETYDWAKVFNGYYMINNLGKLDAAPQVRYMNNLVLNNITFNGFYYFDETGKMVTEKGIHPLLMDSNGVHFDGSYYFGGENGLLLQERGTTPEGFVIDENGRVENLDELGIHRLKPQLDSMLSQYTGEWSVYVKDLNEDEAFMINDKSLYSASLIKAFVMEKTFRDREEIQANLAVRMNAAQDSDAVKTRLDDLLWNMITVSDNESFNELVRLQTDKYDFIEGAKAMNEFLEEEGYEGTSVQHTLAPSSSPSVGLGKYNTTSISDCGKLLNKIYKGESISPKASQEMLDLLLNQKVVWKIPQGLSGDIKVANKTGETDKDQHDIAIVYGEKTTYILCVMSENCPENTAINNIRDISRVVYNYLNL